MCSKYFTVSHILFHYSTYLFISVINKLLQRIPITNGTIFDAPFFLGLVPVAKPAKLDVVELYPFAKIYVENF